MNRAELPDYTPHANGRLMHRSNSKRVVVIASIRSGKTHSFRHDIIREAWNNPTPYACLVTAPTYKLLRATLEDPITSKLKSLGLLGSHTYGEDGGHNRSEHHTVLRNGKEIYYRSLEDPEAAVYGLDVYKCWLDEGTLVTKYAHDLLLGRLVLTNGQLKMGGTPKGTASWVYDEYFGELTDDQDKSRKRHARECSDFIRYRLRDNPVITDEAEAELRASYDPLLAAQEIDGEWVNLSEHSVYYAFDRQLNVAECDFEEWGEIIIGLDYNVGINAWVAMQRDQYANINVLAEGYGAKTTADVGRTLTQQFPRGFRVIDDCSGNARQQGDGRTQREILRQVGIMDINALRANPLIERRVAVVNAHCLNGVGTRHLFVHPRCKRTIKELTTLTYKPNGDIDTQDGKVGHITDALGYGVWYLSGGQAAWDARKPIGMRAA